MCCLCSQVWSLNPLKFFEIFSLRSVSRISAVLSPLWLKFWVLVALTQAVICYSMHQSARSSRRGKKSPGGLYKCHFAILGPFWARENPCMVEVTCQGKTNQNSMILVIQSTRLRTKKEKILTQKDHVRPKIHTHLAGRLTRNNRNVCLTAIIIVACASLPGVKAHILSSTIKK